GQRPEIDGSRAEAEGERVAEGVQIRAAVMVDDALGIAGGPVRVEQTDRLPLVGGSAPLVVGIALLEERLVVLLAQQLAALVKRIVDVDDREPPLDEGE